MPERPVLYIVDGSGYIFRAYYAVRPLSTSKGVPTNAVTGFARMLGKLLKDERPTHLGVAFDSRTKNFRHAIYPAYKANREAPPEDLVPQFELTWQLVAALDIPVLQLDGFEADDIIATLAAQATAAGHDVRVVSGDKDLMQLVTPRVTMLDPMKGKIYDRAGVIERFGVPPELVADVQALAGDSSDNIPGVPKVGDKTASRLVGQYGDVEAVIAGLAQKADAKAAERAVVEHAESARLSKRLAILKTDVPIALDLDALVYRPPRPEKLGPFLKSIEAFGLMRDIGVSGSEAAVRGAAPPPPAPALAPAPAPKTPAPRAPPSAGGDESVAAAGVDRSTYRTILSDSDLRQVLTAAERAGVMSVDTETTSLDAVRADIVGIAIAVPGESPCYVPLAHRALGTPRQLNRFEAVAMMRPLLEDPRLKKVGQNLKYDWLVFSRAGVKLKGIEHDTMLAAWVLDPSRPSFSLDSLAAELLGHEGIKYQDVTRGLAGFDEVPVGEATTYAAEDADLALRLSGILDVKLRQAGLEGLYRDLELPLLPVLALMEEHGVGVDKAALAGLGREFEARLAAIAAQARALGGGDVNLASPRQLAALFFERLGYPVIKKTKTGASTDQEVLEALAVDHELPRVILEHRLLAKLKSTYVDLLPRMINPETGRLHTSFNQTGTATGRLSSSDPNLQNIPIRSDDGRRIRTAFVAAPDHVLISADYSQIELRVMAHLCGDTQFLAAFRRGEDIHTRTATEVLTGGLPPSADDRRRAKAINFGILYGLSEFGLSRNLGIPRAEAHAFMTSYFERYPSVKAFLETTIAKAAADGFVTTILGRRRFLPELKSKNRNIRQGAERIAMNTPIQGSAADLIKRAMIQVAKVLEERRLRTRLLLQVHDELVLEAPTAEVDEVVTLVRTEMAGVMALSVPLVVDVGRGPNWAAAH
ncbi:MAG: DNA polymerase I [Deltaproteobacteria bacterium]|nr:DNA polymerase I [Deltaproteobacteria bacterium]